MRTLVTGATGLVGARLVARLAAEPDAVVLALGRGGEPPSPAPPLAALDAEARARIAWHAVELTDRAGLTALVRELAPQRVVHLAAMAEPRACAAHPAEALAVNAGGTANLLAALESVRAPDARGERPRALVVSSAAVYGPGEGGELDEDAPLRAPTPYGRSKRATEVVAQRAAARGLEVVIARPFNHSAGEQTDLYVLPALARQILAARDAHGPLSTGNLFPERDFLHVEDVLDAYLLLLERGESGAAYNVARGEGLSIGRALELLQERLRTNLEPVPDPARIRHADPPRIVGDAARLRALGWSPRISLEALLAEVADAAAAETDATHT